MIPHGTRNGYNTYRCRCHSCTVAVREYTAEYRMRQELPLDAERARLNAGHVRGRMALWQAVDHAGHAGRVCDEIVRNRPVPARLLMAGDPLTRWLLLFTACLAAVAWGLAEMLGAMDWDREIEQ